MLAIQWTVTKSQHVEDLQRPLLNPWGELLSICQPTRTHRTVLNEWMDEWWRVGWSLTVSLYWWRRAVSVASWRGSERLNVRWARANPSSWTKSPDRRRRCLTSRYRSRTGVSPTRRAAACATRVHPEISPEAVWKHLLYHINFTSTSTLRQNSTSAPVSVHLKSDNSDANLP